MAKKVFVPFQGTVTAEDLNRWEGLRADIFDEATTKAGARTAIGAITIDHAHSNATPNPFASEGTAGFMSGAQANKLHRLTTFPGSTMSVLTTGVVFPLLTQAGEIEFVTLATLQTILGSGGGGVDPPGPTSFGGEAEDTVSQVVGGGEAEDTTVTVIGGGEAEDTVIN